MSSATLLADVLSWFWRMGGIIVGSSNKVPDDLYKNGVQRERLEPFVEALKARCPVVHMRSERDWRALRGDGGKRSWFTFAQRRDFEATLAEIRPSTETGSGGACLLLGCPDRSVADRAPVLQKRRAATWSSSDAVSGCHGRRMGCASSPSPNCAKRSVGRFFLNYVLICADEDTCASRSALQTTSRSHRAITPLS